MKSAKIYPFPRHGRTASMPNVHAENSVHTKKGSIKTHQNTGCKRIMLWAIGLLWLFLAMFWPLFNWLVAMDVVFQFLRAIYYANTPAIHATLQAAIHGALYILLSLFVYLYRPKVF